MSGYVGKIITIRLDEKRTARGKILDQRDSFVFVDWSDTKPSWFPITALNIQSIEEEEK